MKAAIAEKCSKSVLSS